jgi:hypothetical protein
MFNLLFYINQIIIYKVQMYINLHLVGLNIE